MSDAQPEPRLHELVVKRWSPRGFSDRPLDRATIRVLLEAARWSASSFNEQPWRFVVATKDDPAQFERVLSCLVEKNQEWARTAPLLILTMAKKTFTRNGNPNRTHAHDVGLAMATLTLQATAVGLLVHQMAGVDLSKVRVTFAVPDDFEPLTGVAVGYVEDATPPAGRSRKPLNELVFGAEFGEPSPLLV